MKVRLLKIIRDRETKNEIEIPTEIDTDDVRCIYKDRNGVLLSLTNGYTIRVSHDYQEMEDIFVDNSPVQ